MAVFTVISFPVPVSIDGQSSLDCATVTVHE
jgi:hypothetical protein